jgi:ribosomal protein RSM22 (predicted rRNA methylase)
MWVNYLHAFPHFFNSFSISSLFCYDSGLLMGGILNNIPDRVMEHIEEKLKGISQERLKRAFSSLSFKYHEERGGVSSLSEDEKLAYLILRMPATYSVVHEVLGRMQEHSGFTPMSILDVGAGPGTATLACEEFFGTALQATLLERDRIFCDWARKFVRSPITFDIGDLEHMAIGGAFDLVLASYSLGELDAQSFEKVVDMLWQKTRMVFVMIEPGTFEGYQKVMRARAKILATGGYTVAPCPHDKPCPLHRGDWCHFYSRLPRSRLHRLIKGGSLGYEDEKFSYFVASKTAVAPASYSRIIREKRRGGNHMSFSLCSSDGALREETITKSKKERFRLAKNLNWGDILFPE